MKPILAVLFLLLAGMAAAQAPAPTPEKSATPEPKPAGRPLILRLDDVEGPRMSVGASPTEKPPENELPAPGGKPNKALERSNPQAFPIDTERVLKNRGTPIHWRN